MSVATDTCLAVKANRATLTIQIEALLSRIHPTVDRERRRDDRLAIPVLFRLTPYDADRQPLNGEASVVVGKNISRRGLSFYHEKPTPHRRALIELAHPGIGAFMAEIDITWCRFTKPGWYESGGRLIRAVTPTPDLQGDGQPQETIDPQFLPQAGACTDVTALRSVPVMQPDFRPPFWDSYVK